MIGKTDKDLFTDEHAFQALADEQRIIATGEPIVDIEEKETWHEGRVAWYSTSKMPLRDPSGNVIGTFGVSRDITERRLAREALAVMPGNKKLSANWDNADLPARRLSNCSR